MQAVAETLTVSALWHGLAVPLSSLLLSISVGLFVGTLIEALHWTRAVAKVAQPLVRLGRLKDVAGASFSLAFFSGAAANTMLAEAYERGEITRREVMLSNLFNSLPTYFLHLPTLFFIAAPFIGAAAALYVGLTIGAALLRTLGIVLLGRLTLPPLPEGCVACLLAEDPKWDWRGALDKTLKRFRKRLPRMIFYTIPIYVAFFFLKRWGVFDAMEIYMAEHASFLSWLPPQAMGIVVFHMAAETTAGYAAAGALVQTGGLTVKELVLALLVGNILSSPVRAVRHQFPYYAGIFKPALAMKLIISNQALRAASIALVLAGYAYWG
ncbi:MAG: hypothetical protein Q8O35_10160 [Humidesulfovibrio sp.]|uniref:hypothetical protein n=1 Tax=Humidesulfovibrio sp. TaxID=2910988 RepID=UPI0027357B23|nr:hypothetical protein [Humidesulfovibrio sp.]MDP2848541.1 hypothetical protein [Humidesulfovibrio sp.]